MLVGASAIWRSKSPVSVINVMLVAPAGTSICTNADCRRRRLPIQGCSPFGRHFCHTVFGLQCPKLDSGHFYSFTGLTLWMLVRRVHNGGAITPCVGRIYSPQVRVLSERILTPYGRSKTYRLTLQMPACVTTCATARVEPEINGSGTASAQTSQQEKLNLSPAMEQAVTQGLANQPAHSVSGFNGQMGSKLPASEKVQPLPSDVQAQVPEAKLLLFIKLPDRVVLIDPDSQAVAEIVMTPASTTGSAPAPTGSQAR
jgi:hypothetical protein